MMLFRLGKERDYNHKEVANQQKRIDTFKEQGKDEYDIRKQVRFNVLFWASTDGAATGRGA